MWLINGLKKRTLYIDGWNQIWAKVMKSLFQNVNILISVTWPFEKCGLHYELWGHLFKILTHLYQSRKHFKNVDCSTSSIIFAKFDLLARKKELLHIDGWNQIWAKVMKSLIQNINILISFAWPSQTCGLEYFQFNIH